MSPWIEFSACVAVIGVAGTYLTRYGDAIADKTGLGGSWVGVVMLATVTSLPELASGVTAVTLAAAPDVAVGNLTGACAFNLLVLALVALFKRGEPLYAAVGPEHLLTAGFGILMLGVAGAGLATSQVGFPLAIGHVGLATIALLPLYLLSIAVLHRHQTRAVVDFTTSEPDAYPGLSLAQVTRRYAASALAVVAGGIWLPYVTVALGAQMGWHQSFTGTLFTAFATSLPELVVTLAALRLGAIDMAVGNLLGSNLFNMVVLAVDDLFYRPGPLLADVSPAHLVSTLSVLAMTGAALIGLYQRSHHRWWSHGDWTSLLLVLLFIANSVLVYRISAPGPGQ